MNHGIHRIHGMVLLAVVALGTSLAAFAADPAITVSARQRYPWNGLVDVHFTITGDVGTKYDTSFAAKDMVGNTNITMATVRKADGSTANVTKEQLTPGSYNWVWDVAADLPDGFQCDRVTVTGTANISVFPYSVKFNANGGSGTMANESFTYGTAKALTVNAFTRTGYTFQGWATSASGSKVYNDKQSVSNLTETSGAVVNLYAVWKSALYMVIDLSSGSSSSSYPVSYLAAVPSGGWDNTYKTTKVVLRRIEAGTFKEAGKRNVTLTKPFYIGVFEMTQKQIALINGQCYGYFYYSDAPLNIADSRLSYNTIRGSNNGTKWPSSNAVDASSLIGKIRSRTGVEFDLPTEAQWEYACRAGTTSLYNNGGSSESDLDKLGYYRKEWDVPGGRYDIPKVGGSYLANAWGLYDMHGNVEEWCLDWYSEFGTTAISDPKGESSGSHRVSRGGSYRSEASEATSQFRNHYSPDTGNYTAPDYTYDARYLGFRICLTLSN